MQLETDLLVIGTGIAGLSCAIYYAENHPESKITLISKRNISETNTRYAQGGIAVVTDFLKDSFSKHKTDTLNAGDGLCDPEVVDFVVKEGPQRLEELLSWGVAFDHNEKGFHLGKEGGHSASRIVHYKDRSGFQIQEGLISRMHALPNIELLEYHSLVDLITDHHLDQDHFGRCYGAYVININNHKVQRIAAKATVLSTGGAGQLYAHTTNPEGATGDGLGAAYRAKVTIKHLQFVQFHPTALHPKANDNTFLISEAVRGAGAQLKNIDGFPFMKNYDVRGELASRDIVARAIDSELKKASSEWVWLDCTSISKEVMEDEFPTILDTCRSIGIDPLKDPIPVVPAAHYFCGGIAVDQFGRTDLDGLYAIGECSQTGLHGANRLASNSLLEALVFAKRSADQLSEEMAHIPYDGSFLTSIPRWKDQGYVSTKKTSDLDLIKKQLQSIMSKYVGIVRSREGLNKAFQETQNLFHQINTIYNTKTLSLQLSTLRNMIAVAHLLIDQAQNFSQNKGTHYIADDI
ncbi:MAG: L-aspartate oxidase [Flavobacteriaceae bacterium]|jgi:L-aspartate oxidase